MRTEFHIVRRRFGTGASNGGAVNIILRAVCITIGALALLFLFMNTIGRMPEAQRRAQRSRANADIKALGAAVRYYHDANKIWPASRPFTKEPAFEKVKSKMEKANGLSLTTFDPVAQMPSGTDPFSPGGALNYAYYTDGKGCVISSPGPDGVYDFHPQNFHPGDLSMTDPAIIRLSYDPTNGIYSAGDIILTIKYQP